MSKLIKNMNSKIELQILKYVQGHARTPKEIETFFSDVPMLNDVLEKLQFKLYLKRDIKNYAAYKTYMINANLEKEIKEIESYKTVKTDEPKETVHYTFIDFKSFQKVYSIDGYDLAKEYVYNIAKEQFLRTENEIEDGEGEAEILENGNFFVSHNCMGNDFCCEALFEMTQKKQMVRLKVRKCYYTDEIKNQKHGFTNEFEPVIYQKQIQKKKNMKYQFIHMSKHRFDKVNLITTKKGDEYKCNDCGCNGFRDGLRPFIMVKKGKDMSFCPKGNYQRPVTVQVIESVCIQFGLDVNKIYTVVDSPDPKYINDVWVFSEQRNEPVRLLDGEFLRVTDATVTDAPLATAKNDLVDELITDVFKRRDLDNKGTVQEHFNALKEALETVTPESLTLATVTPESLAMEMPESLATETIELTELENKVLNCFIDLLKGYDFSFSDIICFNLVKPTQLKLSQIKGVIGSLTKKGLVFTDDMDTKHDLIFLAEKAYSLHSEWKEHAVNYFNLQTNHLQIKIIPTKAKTELPTVTDEPLATVTDEPLATITNEPTVTITDEPLATITDEPTVTDEPLATITDEPTVTDEPLATIPKKAKEPKNDKDDNMIKTALAEMFKTVTASNSEIYEKCNLSKSELSEFKAAKRSTSLNKALEIACHLGAVSPFLKTLEGLIKNKVESFTGKKFKVESKQMLLF